MASQTSWFNRLLLVGMIVLFVVSLGGFTYTNWRVEPEHELWMILLNSLILSLPLVLFFGSLYVLISAWRERRLTGQIGPRLAKVIFWAPRIAAIAITFFVSLFSLDVFGSGTLLEQIGGFLMHNIPTFVMIVLLVFAWRRPMIGFIAFLVVGVFFLRFVVMGPNLGHFLLFSGPMLLVAALFYADWRWQMPIPPPTEKASEL